jgi:aminoglycoside phosphotransferase (APT) family kinase protein
MTEIDQNQFKVLLRQFAPDDQLQTVEALTYGFSNRSFRINTTRPDNTQTAYVVKRYAEWEHSTGTDSKSRAMLEYEVLKFVHSVELPCPEPVYFNLNDEALGSAILVTKGLRGEQIMAHPANPLWAEKAPIVAEWLAHIHKLQCPDDLIPRLPDVRSQFKRFTENDTIPDYMREHPDGESIWYIVHENMAKLISENPSLVHGDYWSGNMLWEQGQLTGILDWENVVMGNAGLDVANCRLEMIIDGMNAAASEFLKIYEAHIGKPVKHLGLCELVVATDPMWQHAPFLTVSPYQERFRQFVADAKKRL